MCGWFRREHSCDFQWVGKVGAVSEQVADDVGRAVWEASYDIECGGWDGNGECAGRESTCMTWLDASIWKWNFFSTWLYIFCTLAKKSNSYLG